MKIVITILRMCSGRVTNDNSVQNTIKDQKTTNFDEFFAKFVIYPQSKYVLIWGMFMTIIYLLSIFLDSLVLAFHLHPLTNPGLQNWSTVFTIFMIIDIIVKFFVAIRPNTAEL